MLWMRRWIGRKGMEVEDIEEHRQGSDGLSDVQCEN